MTMTKEEAQATLERIRRQYADGTFGGEAWEAVDGLLAIIDRRPILCIYCGHETAVGPEPDGPARAQQAMAEHILSACPGRPELQMLAGLLTVRMAVEVIAHYPGAEVPVPAVVAAAPGAPTIREVAEAALAFIDRGGVEPEPLVETLERLLPAEGTAGEEAPR